MNLFGLIDIGNSRIKWALAQAGRLVTKPKAIRHDAVADLFNHWEALPAAPDAVRLVSVIDQPVVQAIEAWAQQQWGVAPQRLRTPAQGGGITIAYHDPSQLGTDRWLAMVGARVQELLPCCLVDSGSAITLDAVTADGQHRGGLILPGFAAQQAGLAQIAPALTAPDFDAAAPLLAFNTADAVTAGLMQGTAAAIEQLAARMSADIGMPLPVVLTGGDAARLNAYLQKPATVANDLVLAGLASLD